MCRCVAQCLLFFSDTPTTEIYTLSLHDALPISALGLSTSAFVPTRLAIPDPSAERPTPPDFVRPRSGLRLPRSEEHTSELQSRLHLVCRLLLEKKKTGPTIRLVPPVTSPTPTQL